MTLPIYGLCVPGKMNRALCGSGSCYKCHKAEAHTQAPATRGSQRAIRCPAPSINSRGRYIITTAPALSPAESPASRCGPVHLRPPHPLDPHSIMRFDTHDPSQYPSHWQPASPEDPNDLRQFAYGAGSNQARLEFTPREDVRHPIRRPGAPLHRRHTAFESQRTRGANGECGTPGYGTMAWWFIRREVRSSWFLRGDQYLPCFSRPPQAAIARHPGLQSAT